MAAAEPLAATGPAPANTDPAERAGLSRGTITIAIRTIEKIAEHAALEVSHVGSDAGGVLGIGARRDFSTHPSASASRYGEVVVLRLDVGIDFPRPLSTVLAQLRAHVGERVGELTGLTVGRMDVAVSWLHPASARTRELA